MTKLVIQKPHFYLPTRYTPQIMTKIADEKPSSISIIESFVKSGNNHGIIVISKKQMSKALHKSLNTIYSDIRYLAKNEYIAVGSIGGSTHNVFMLNPSIFWFKDAAYVRHHQNVFPSAVALGKNRNRKFYKMTQTFYKIAQHNMERDPIFAKRVKKITKDNHTGIIKLSIGQDKSPVEDALTHVLYLHLHNKALSVVRFVFAKLKLSSVGLYSATNKDIYKEMQTKHIKVSFPTVERTMTKLSKHHIILRYNNSKIIAFSPKFYEESKKTTKRIEYIKRNNVLKQQKKDRQSKKQKHDFIIQLEHKCKEAKRVSNKLTKLLKEKRNQINHNYNHH